MGLDMYLYRVPKVKSIEELNEIDKRLHDAYMADCLASELKKIKVEKDYIYDIDFSIESYFDKEKAKENPDRWGFAVDINIRIAYWRKFNALHIWFVKNVQDGVDDCGDYLITKDHLIALQSALNILNKENAAEIFPTQTGFFFGGTEYDERYWERVEDLKCEVKFILEQQPSDTSLIYHSSW